jgi:hypothetical protein
LSKIRWNTVPTFLKFAYHVSQELSYYFNLSQSVTQFLQEPCTDSREKP